MHTAFHVTSARERLQVIDSLRGFALLGIILANIPLSHEPVRGAWLPPGSNADAVLRAVLNILVSTKFITLFSILFGAGFYLQFKKAADFGVAFKSYFFRRMLLLLLIGSLHAYLLWQGDIIRYYALCGMALLLLYRLPQRSILTWSVLFIVPLTALVFIASKALELQYSYDPGIIGQMFATGSYTRYLYFNFTIDSLHNFAQDAPLTFVSCFGKILLGYWLARSGFFDHPERFYALTRKWIWLGATLGIGSSIGYWAITTGRLELDLPLLWLVFLIAGGLVLHSLLYLGLFVRLFYGRSQRVLQVFAPAGKMALTNYLLQTVFCMILFYRWTHGPSLFARIGAAETFLIALGIYLLQLAYSHWHMRRFQQGPVEYLWRKFAYLKAKQTGKPAASAVSLEGEFR